MVGDVVHHALCVRFILFFCALSYYFFPFPLFFVVVDVVVIVLLLLIRSLEFPTRHVHNKVYLFIKSKKKSYKLNKVQINDFKSKLIDIPRIDTQLNWYVFACIFKIVYLRSKWYGCRLLVSFFSFSLSIFIRNFGIFRSVKPNQTNAKQERGDFIRNYSKYTHTRKP